MEVENISYKHLPAIQIACIKTRVEDRSHIFTQLERLRQACGDSINAPAMVIFHNGALQHGFLVEVAFPVSRAVEAVGVYTRTLEEAKALCSVHQGCHDSVNSTVTMLYQYLRQHAWTTSLLRREVYHTLDPQNPHRQVTEVQVILHEWDRYLSEAAERELGTDARARLMMGADSITPETSSYEYASWVHGAMQRLDELSDDSDQKCRIVSHCAHVFPQERIDFLRSLYLQHGSVDDVLKEMYRDEFWYENPVRRGNVIYMRKNPFDPEGYANASTSAGRRKAYCHCPFVKPFLDEIPAKISPTFCYCGAGWYRRLWEGILCMPVQIEHVETLLKGNDQCTMRITLPLELEGGISPETA